MLNLRGHNYPLINVRGRDYFDQCKGAEQYWLMDSAGGIPWLVQKTG